MSPIYQFHRRRDRRPMGSVRVRAANPRAAFERIRRERPDYAADQLILTAIATDTPPEAK